MFLLKGNNAIFQSRCQDKFCRIFEATHKFSVGSRTTMGGGSLISLIHRISAVSNIIAPQTSIQKLNLLVLFLTPDFFKRALLNYWGVSNQSQTGMDERPIWVHKFSRKKQIPHGSIHPLPQHILLVKFRTVKTKMIIKSSFFFQKFSSIGT